MKKSIYTLFALSILTMGSVIILTSSSNGRAFAANSGNTGAPGEATTCRSCHGSGFGTTVSMLMTDTNGAPATSYIPGTVYNITFTVNSTGGTRWGYQLTSLTSNNTPIANFTNPSSNTRIVTLGNGRQYAEHAGKSTTNSFSMNWTAPPSGTGNVFFYGGGAAVNNNGGTNGDGGNTLSINIPENTSVGIVEPTLSDQFLVYPNPAKNFIKLKNSTVDLNEVTASIFDTSGRLVITENLSIKSDKVEKINTSKLKSGYYILKVISDQESFEKKILIQ